MYLRDLRIDNNKLTSQWGVLNFEGKISTIYNRVIDSFSNIPCVY